MCIRDSGGRGHHAPSWSGGPAPSSGASAPGGSLWERPCRHERRHPSGAGPGTESARAPLIIDKEQIDTPVVQRAHDIVQAKANKALDAAEKPDEMLDLSYQQMLEQITQVRRALVDIAASRKQIELQEQQLQHSVDHLQDQAKAAISKTFGDSGATLQRAQDKIATMQAHAGAVDELLQSGVLEDVGGGTDDIQKELDEAGSAAEVDKELAALKAEVTPGGSG